jgi:hypothetical protein
MRLPPATAHRLSLLFAVLLLPCAGCGRPAPHVESEPPSPDLRDAALALHRAATDAAWTAFSQGQAGLGWPLESGAPTAAAYLEMLGEYGAPLAELPLPEISIANLSDSDPGETAFLKINTPARGMLVVRKDGAVAVFGSDAEIRSFAPLPPREPAWLP